MGTRNCPLKEHKRWSAACPFVNKLNVGNEPVASNNEEFNRKRDVCGFSTGKHLCLYLFCYISMFSTFPSVIHSMFFTIAESIQQKPNKSRGPLYPQYATVETRLKTFKPLPIPIEDIVDAGFFNSGLYFTIYYALYM